MRRLSLIAAFILAFLPAAACFAQGPDAGIQDMPVGDIYFATGSAELTDAAKKTVDEIFRYVNKRPGSMVLLAGYDDQRTPEKESVELGWKRANAVRDRLVKLGADAAAVNTISFGNTKVALSGEGEEVWARNRRVRYRVAPPVGTEKMESMPSGVCQRCKK
jgi:outer membrane protein OmpA-like peptidoglycan-associated protein